MASSRSTPGHRERPVEHLERRLAERPVGADEDVLVGADGPAERRRSAPSTARVAGERPSAEYRDRRRTARTPRAPSSPRPRWSRSRTRCRRWETRARHRPCGGARGHRPGTLVIREGLGDQQGVALAESAPDRRGIAGLQRERPGPAGECPRSCRAGAGPRRAGLPPGVASRRSFSSRRAPCPGARAPLRLMRVLRREPTAATPWDRAQSCDHVGVSCRAAP